MRLIYLAGANSIHSYKWIKYFSDAGFQIIWISFEPNAFSKLSNVKYLTISHPKSFLRFIIDTYSLKRLFKVRHDDIFHIHSIGAYGLLGWILSWRKKNKFIVSPWGSDLIFGRKKIFKRIIIKKILTRASLITCDAIFIRKMVSELISNEDKVKIINFGIDTKQFKRSKFNENKVHDEFLGLKIISTRNFESVYDVKTLILACKKLQNKQIKFHLKLVGTGSQEEELKKLVTELGLDNLVDFVGRVPNDRLVNELCDADVYVSTSLSDAGIAASTAEAMACMLPVIITDTAENNEWITDGINGYLFKPSDFDELANKLIEAQNAITSSELGRAARKTIVERNDYLVEMEKMNSLYNSLND